MAPPKHAELRIKKLDETLSLLEEKIGRVQNELVVEHDVLNKFKLEKKLELFKEEREKLEKEMIALTEKVERDNFFRKDYQLEARYEIIEELGRGAFAVVHKVRDKTTENISALKILHPKNQNLQFQSLEIGKVLKRFWAEGKILGILGRDPQHHIVKVRNMGQSADNKYFIEMECIDGKTLDQLLQEKGKFPSEQVLEILSQLTKALKHVHKYDIIHRDLKPSNIIIDENNRITLMDFGIAKRLECQSLMTSMDRFLGTLAYSSPEQFDCEEFGEVSARTDIYSLGILAYHLLIGKLPYNVTSRTRAMRGHCDKQLPKLPKDIPSSIAQIIYKCTQKAQIDRYQSVDELHKIIKQIVAGELIAETLTGFENLLGLEFILVKGGTFSMGDTFGDGFDRETPIHDVTLDDFYISKYQITNGQYAKFLNETQADKKNVEKWVNLEGSYNKERCRIYKEDWEYRVEKGYEDFPVIYISWYGAKAFCDYYNVNLPTEAQWEFAARGGTKTKKYTYSGSNKADEVAWYGSNSGSKTHKVGTKKPNELGIYDMSGNVWEWCADWYGEYPTEAQMNPTGPRKGTGRVLRGGSWYDLEYNLRVTNRNGGNPDYWYDFAGFRISRRISK